MNTTTQTPEVNDQSLGLPRLVLEARVRLGPEATPETVADYLRGQMPEISSDQVKDVWDEGHLPG
jgi:hypothetical protein